MTDFQVGLVIFCGITNLFLMYSLMKQVEKLQKSVDFLIQR